jgi:hypothetical protein
MPMDRDGFFPAQPCRRCGKPLCGQGTGYPAELYAGTYTGLCYHCTGAGAFATGETLPSGAAWWDWPPSCPSHRRDRERYYAFEGCEKCRGQGGVYVPRSFGQGGGYMAQCPVCRARHEAHPTTIAQREADARRAVACDAWRTRMEAEFQARLQAAGLAGKPESCTCGPKWMSVKCPACVAQQAAIDPIATAVLAEGPKAPEGETVPEFPEGWAQVPAPKKARGGRGRKAAR